MTEDKELSCVLLAMAYLKYGFDGTIETLFSTTVKMFEACEKYELHVSQLEIARILIESQQTLDKIKSDRT